MIGAMGVQFHFGIWRSLDSTAESHEHRKLRKIFAEPMHFLFRVLLQCISRLGVTKGNGDFTSLIGYVLFLRKRLAAL